MTNAIQTEETAAQWLLRCEQPEWTAQNQAELDAWLDADAENKTAYWRLEYGWRKVDRIAALRSPTIGSHRGRRPLRHGWRRFALIAASIAGAAACLVVFTTSTDFWKHKTYETDIGARETVSLNDGSTIELNTATVLRAAVDAKVRDVWLERGEAYFEVAHDPSRPFIVHAGDRTITVLGTKFSVWREGTRVNVSVVEGRVRVDDAQSRNAPSIVTKGDVVLAQGASNLIAHKSAGEVDTTLSWRQGLLRFDQSTLADAAAEFNRYNRKRLVVTGANVAQMRIGGSFEPSNVDAFARLLRQAYGLKIEENGNEIKISE